MFLVPGSRHYTMPYNKTQRRGTKINFNQNILCPLLVDTFLHFTVPMMFNIGMFQWINIRKTKLPNKLKNNKNQCHNISVIYSTPKNETLVFISQIIRLKQKINFHCKAVVSRDFQTPVYRFWWPNYEPKRHQIFNIFNSNAPTPSLKFAIHIKMLN